MSLKKAFKKAQIPFFGGERAFFVILTENRQKDLVHFPSCQMEKDGVC